MVEPQSTRFWQSAIQSGLIDAAALKACWERIPAAKRTPEAAERRIARQAVVIRTIRPAIADGRAAGIAPRCRQRRMGGCAEHQRREKHQAKFHQLASKHDHSPGSVLPSPR